jgi:hypothetical protein
VDGKRTVTVDALREFDAERLAQSVLGPETDAGIAKHIAHRGRNFPGRVMEAARAATQLGVLIREGERWRQREQRVLRPRGSRSDLVARRVADLPEAEHEALRIAVALGDGAGRDEMIAAIRGTVSSRAAELFATLQSLGFVGASGEQVRLSASLRAAVPRDNQAVSVLFGSGALQPAAAGESLLRAGRTRESAASFARAARNALEGKLRAAAVRYLAAARPPGGTDRLADDVKAVMRSVADAIGSAVVVTRHGGEPDTVSRPRAVDPEYLEQTAAHLAERNDVEGAARLRTLAEVVRGNSQKALRISGSHSSEGSSRSQLVAALAQAGAGEMHVAIRSALTALAIARKAHERSGEAAALAVLSTLYKASGHEAESRGLAESARKLQSPASHDPAGTAVK